MIKNLQFLSTIWQEFYQNIERYDGFNGFNEDEIRTIFRIGKNYHYSISLCNSQLLEVSDHILDIHNLQSKPNNLLELLDLIFPDDLEFCIYAEKWGLEQLIKSKNILNHKIGYFIRLKVDVNNYKLFYHQTYYCSDKASKNKISKCIHFNTNISDIFNSLNYEIKIFNISEEKIYNKTYFIPSSNLLFKSLTKRELEVIKLIAQGYTDKIISEMLFVSHNTIRTHRKNILKKTKTNNSIDLIRKFNEIWLE